MKNIIHKISGRLFILLGLCFFTICCDEEFLDEIPKDFLSTDNAYTDIDGFEAGIAGLHSRTRDFWMGNWDQYTRFGMYTDLAYSYNDANFNAVNPSDGSWPAGYLFLTNWAMAYDLIKASNVIINRAEMEDVQWTSETQKSEIVAEARFFRAWAHNLLACLFGGVPIVKEEISTPKLDFVRNTRAEVFQFCKEDLAFAAAKLPEEEKKPGRITKAAANFLLTEVNLSLGDRQGAIDAASLVINNPKYKLMTERFGRKVDQPGDVITDLHTKGNINRNTGNTETIWALQLAYNIPGGSQGWLGEFQWGPRLDVIRDPDGVNVFINRPEFSRPHGHITQTVYAMVTIWEESPNDMRNSSHNIKREFYVNNPASKYFGQKIDMNWAIPLPQNFRSTQPLWMKTTTPFEHPGPAGPVWKDLYAMRLAELYLLRAEAYLGIGDQVKAAADINVVRARANATPVDAANVDIDYILDERARELMTEEMRLRTLFRLGLYVERVKKYNYRRWADGTIEPTISVSTIQPHHNLCPIPQSAIDMNIEAVLEQNPGY